MTSHVFLVFKSDEGASPFQAHDFLHFTDFAQHEVYQGEREDLITRNRIMVDLQGSISAEGFKNMMSNWLEKCNTFTQKWGNEKLTQDLRTCVNEGWSLIGKQLLHFGASASPNEHATVVATAFNDVVAQAVNQHQNGANVQNVMDFLEGTIIRWPASTSETFLKQFVATMVEQLRSAL